MTKQKSWKERERSNIIFCYWTCLGMMLLSLTVILITGKADWYTSGHLIISAIGFVSSCIWFALDKA